MAENRTQQWRDAKRKQGLKAVTMWLSAEEERRLKDLAATWHCSPSELMQHALALFHPGRPPCLSDDIETTLQQRSANTDMTQIRAWLQDELPGMVRQIVEQLALDTLLAGPSHSDETEDELIQDSDATDYKQRNNSNITVIKPIQHSDVTEIPEPAYDTTLYRLGRLCLRGHAYQQTGQSLRYRKSKRCIECDTEDARARRKTKRGG